ncbi:MAG TPA: tetratricopeptide repeat protein [Pseudolabrys sp.]
MAKSKPHPAPADTADALRRALGFHRRGNFPQAEELYVAVLATQPDNFDALHLYGVMRHQSGQHAEALALIARALRTNSRSAAAHSNYGTVLAVLNRSEEALASYAQAVALQPDFIDALIAQSNTLYALGRFAEALSGYERVLAIKPDFAEIHNNCGNALWCLRRPREALAHFDAALALKPDYAEAHNNRGNALLDLNRAAEALAGFERALSLKAGYADALVNRGNALRDLDRDDEALECFERAIALSPQLAEAHWNKALLHLSHGDFEKGWPGYEWRWRRAGASIRGFTQPLWRGEDLRGKTILLHAEQGFGDTIQFARYVPMVAARGARVILEVPDAVMPLLASLDGVGALIGRGVALPAFDLHCPLLSLPLAFGTTLATIPGTVPYLRVPEDRMAIWRALLPPTDRLRVGLAWSGKPSHANDHNRSIPLAQFAPLLAIPDIIFISLQRDIRESDHLALESALLHRLDERLADFADTAAAIAQCDLVIGVDTAVAHLAGSLGKPLWLLLPHGGDWRWLMDREDSPWYPNARLFRQPSIGDWNSVIARLAAEIALRT